MPFQISGRAKSIGALSVLFAAYSAYVYTLGTAVPGAPPLSREVRAGFRVFQANNCIACHQLYGLGGYMGPDLTSVTAAPGKGADYARIFIESGTLRMPNLGLSEAEIDSLIHLLEYTAASGPYPPLAPQLSWYGTVEYEGAPVGKEGGPDGE